MVAAAEAREVSDVTGAGDTVIAALALGLAAGASLADAAHLANRAAGIVVGKFGPATVNARARLRADRSARSMTTMSSEAASCARTFLSRTSNVGRRSITH